MSDLSFRIEASSKAFEILASNLYSDKVSAVIRELSCNAADAHVEAGKSTVPFSVHIPTAQKMQFIVRDYGNGLRADQIEDVFTVFFSSTKLGSKAYTGAFGLGCKSPFAVTNNFFVNSYIDGKKYSYECFRNSENVPSIKFIGENPSTENSGLEIIVPINSNPVEWTSRAVIIYDSFKIRPKTNIPLTYFSNTASYIYGNNWENTERSGTWVCMNNVRYKLDINKIDKSLRNDGAQFRNRGICYIVPPRSIEVTPSREEVSYTESTVNFLNEFIYQVHSNIRKEFQETIEKAPSMFMAKVAYMNIVKKYSEEYISFREIINPTLYSWKGTLLSSHTDVSPSISYGENIEIGYMVNGSKYSANKKETLLTNIGFKFPTNPTKDSFVVLINDTKASQESIKAWINRTMKHSNSSNVLFLVVKAEYAFIIKDTNKIDEKFITTCSRQGLHKITRSSSGAAKAVSKNITLHLLSIKDKNIQNITDKQNDSSDDDPLLDIADENGNIYFIEYEYMNYESIESIYTDETKNTRLSDVCGQFNSLEALSFNMEDRFVNKSDKFLLIKNLKKNKDFMKKFAKDNKVRFLPYVTVFKNAAGDYLESNPDLLELIFRNFAILFWWEKYNHYVESLNNSFDLYIQNTLFTERFSKICDIIMQHFFEDNQFKHQSEEFSSIRDVMVSVFDKDMVMLKNIRSIIGYIKYTQCENNYEKFDAMLQKYSKMALDFANAVENFCDKTPALFLDEEAKEKKIVEYYLTGKIS